jgi:hypothetical protein
MVIRFNCFGSAVAIGFWRKGFPTHGGIGGVRLTKWEELGAPGKWEKWRSWEGGLWESGNGYPGRGRYKAPPGEDRNVEGGIRWGTREPVDDYLFQLAQTVITELRPHIWAAGIRKQGKRDLLLSLLRLLKSYTALTVLQAYPFRVAINNFIEMETASRCSIHLNNEELLALWREVR